jgi:putative ABC transport system substrate-binding protein
MTLRRRDFLTVLGGAAAAWPLAARAQQQKAMKRVGVLITFSENDRRATSLLEGFRGELRDRGWVEGSNLVTDVRWIGNDTSRMRTLAAELLSMRPDAIFATSSPALMAAQQQTQTVPLVFVLVADAVASGFANSMAHPGGNITGFNSYEFSIGGKWLELLAEIAPTVSEAAAILEPGNTSNAGNLKAIENAASSTGIKLSSIAFRTVDEIERAIDTYAKQPHRGLIVLANPTTNGNRERLAAAVALSGYRRSTRSAISSAAVGSPPMDLTF